MVNYLALGRSLVILPKISGILSCIGSGLLARHITKKGFKDVSLTSRMLLGISIVDILGSFVAYFLGSWMAPRGTLTYSAGNTATCSFQGFVLVFNLVYFATAYAELAAIYWLMVRRGWTQNKMKRKMVTFGFLSPPILIGFIAAIPPLFFEFYNPALINCYLNEFPPGCRSDPEKPCSRGERADTAQIAVYSYLLLGNLVVVAFILLLVLDVHRQEKKSDKYLAKGQTKNRKNSISTAWQGVRYASAYFLTYVTFYIILGYDVLGNEGAYMSAAGKYTLEYFFVILSPLVGAFNAGVYFYPRYTAKRQQNPDSSRAVCLCMVLGFDGLGERLSGMSRGKTGSSSTPGDVKRGSLSEEEQKEEERPDEDYVGDPKVTSDVA